MSESSNDLQPTVDEVLQAEVVDDVNAPVPVRVVGADVPVRTQDLPRKGGATRTRTVDNVTWQRVLNADHRRAKATVVSIGQNILIALNSAGTQVDASASLWPQLEPFYLTAATELWVKAVTATTSVSVTTELWAMGEGSD